MDHRVENLSKNFNRLCLVFHPTEPSKCPLPARKSSDDHSITAVASSADASDGEMPLVIMTRRRKV
jgi:hypothetical protein